MSADRAAGARWAVLSVLASVVVNAVLGIITLLPAAFVVLEVSVTWFGQVITEHNTDPGFYRAAAIFCAVLIALLFVGCNAALLYLLPGRPYWLWLVALAVYPLPYLVDLWSSR
ncbi:hypothetical protein [Pimelobacter simplex]|uniref:hypothetical protein n=1 Tax=Nocardioides simplex TaxID=2045 RepID=UPI003AAD36AB